MGWVRAQPGCGPVTGSLQPDMTEDSRVSPTLRHGGWPFVPSGWEGGMCPPSPKRASYQPAVIVQSGGGAELGAVGTHASPLAGVGVPAHGGDLGRAAAESVKSPRCPGTRGGMDVKDGGSFSATLNI